MKSGMFKRVLALGLMAVMLAGDILPTAAETVSGGDVAEAGIVDAPQKEDAESPDGDTPVADAGAGTGETVSAGDTVEIRDEESPLEESPYTSLEPITVDGVTITVSGSKSAFKEGTTVTAAAVEPAQVVIEAAEEQEQAVVKKYKAFDINLVCDGETVQPLNGEEITVSFAGDMLIPDEKNEDVAVYHVDDQEQITKMDAAVSEENGESVDMTTTHFSTYVIVVTDVTTDREVIFYHYLGTPGSRKLIYAPTSVTVSKDHFMQSELPVQGGGNYTVTQVHVTSDGKVVGDYVNDPKEGNIEIRLEGSKNIVDIYYEEVDKTYENQTTFFDYYIDGKKQVEEKVQKYQGDSIGKSFTINGDTRVYTSNWTFDKNNGRLILDRWPKREIYALKDQDVLHLDGGDTWTYHAADKMFYHVIVRNASYNAGINEGTDYNRPILAMGLSNWAANTSDGVAYNVTGNVDWVDLHKGLNVNTNSTASTGLNGTDAIVPGLVERLEGKNYENLVMGYAKNKETGKVAQIQDPGYFNSTTNNNKAIYENYSLHFKLSGNTYVLDYAQNDDIPQNKTYSYKNGSGGEYNNNFFPLSDVEPIGGRTGFQPSGWEGANGHNLYFGMRYDFTFSIGDYVGDMLYEFMGDDDLWVFVDGKLALDMGGMHSAYPFRYSADTCAEANSVDLWNYLFGFSTEEARIGLNQDQKDATHTVSILYMERGGYESTCGMKFVIPNVEAKPPVVSRIPYADLKLVKKDSMTKENLKNVGFTLYKDAECKNPVSSEKYTAADGTLTFTGLRQGTYYLKETRYDAASYLENSTVYTVQVIVSGEGEETTAEAVIEGLPQESGAYVVYNTPILTTTLEFVKVNRYTHERLAGVRFLLKENDKNGAVIAEAVTAADGSFKYEKIREGIYYLEEDEATVPEGYKKPEKGWTIKVENKNGQLEYDVIDSPAGLWWKNNPQMNANLVKNEPYVDFSFEKIDAMTALPMQGVEFKLYEGTGKNAVSNAPVAAAKSDAQGKVSFEKALLVGQKYLLVETTPEGYEEVKNPWIVVVEYKEIKQGQWDYVASIYTAVLQGNTWKEDKQLEQAVIKNVPMRGKLIITKTVDQVNLNNGAATFTFELKGPNGLVMYRTITFEEATSQESSKSITINNLPVGSYTVREMDNLRYTLVSANNVTRTVTSTSTPEFGFKNVKKPDKYYYHSDVVINSFRQDEDGNVTITRTREVSEETEVIVEAE